MRTADHGQTGSARARRFFFPFLAPQLEDRDTHHVHERSYRFVIHEWEGLRQVHFLRVEMAQVPTYLTAYKKIGDSHCLPRRPSAGVLGSSKTPFAKGGGWRILEMLPWTVGEPFGSDVDRIIQILPRTGPWRRGVYRYRAATDAVRGVLVRF